jgi:hypothetical protein
MGSCGGVRNGASEGRSGEWGGGQRRAPVALLEPQARPASQRASLSASRGGRGLPLGYDGRSSQGHDFLHHKEGAVGASGEAHGGSHRVETGLSRLKQGGRGGECVIIWRKGM